MAESQQTVVEHVVHATAQDQNISQTAPRDIPIKHSNRQRLLRGLHRISSASSLNGLRRSKSTSGPYKESATISCVSLAGTGPPSQTPSSVRSATPQPSPLGYHSASSSLSSSPGSEFPFYDAVEGVFAARKVDSSALTSNPSSVALPTELRVRAQSKPKPVFRFFESIPHEIQVEIFSYLQPKERVRASSVSKSFYRFCFDGQLWASFDASEFHKDIPAEAVSRIITAAGPFIRNLNLRGCVQVEHYKRTEAIVKACKNLVNAKLEGCRNIQKTALTTLLSNNHSLVHLNMTGLSAVTSETLDTLAQFCPQLESLNISWCEKVRAEGIRSVVECCFRLRELRAGEVRGFENLALAESIFITNNLQRLVLSGCVELTDEALQIMMHGVEPEIDILTGRPEVPPRKLRHLDLSGCAGLTNDGVQSIGYNTPELEGLQLSGCKRLTDPALEPILASTPRLSHLELEDLEDLSNNLLSEHLAKAPCASILEHLSLSYCEKISDVGVLPVMEKCVNLRSIDLDNTRISDLSLAEAAAMVQKRSIRTTNKSKTPEMTLQLVVYDCANVTWTGVREVLYRNTQVMTTAGRHFQLTYPTEAISIKCFYGFQMTVDEHMKRVLKGDLDAARRLERKWADYMQATEEAGMLGSGHRRRRRRAREAHANQLNEEDPAQPGRRRARTAGACAVM